MSNAIALRPSYWASVSGSKDSLYMLKLIFEHPEKYPLDGVVHFELEIDYPFIRDVIDYMEAECKKHGVRFVRIKPRKKWMDLYEKWGYPTRPSRWCNSSYKLDAQKQLDQHLKSLGYYAVHYVGYCADEMKRFKPSQGVTQVYPLADFGIQESEILEWAKTVPVFNDYYRYNRRCGCMGCPMSSRLELAYLLRYYPVEYERIMEMAKKTERERGFHIFHGQYSAEYVDNNVRTKWTKKLEELDDQRT